MSASASEAASETARSNASGAVPLPAALSRRIVASRPSSSSLSRTKGMPRRADVARLLDQAERELGRQAEARQPVAPAARDHVAVGGLLRTAGGQLQEV